MANDGLHLISEHDMYLFREGRHFRTWELLGSRLSEDGATFTLWAPNAREVSVVGDFNGWKGGEYPLELRQDGSGIWEGMVAGIGKGDLYKYFISSRFGGYEVEKGDPYALAWERPPGTASRIWDLEYEWRDSEWMAGRKERTSLDAPLAIYEVHLDSFRRVPEEQDRPLSYREMAEHLPRYLFEMGYTHVEFLPVMEHPFTGSWGYQVSGYFAPTARYGTPQDFMYLVDTLHQAGIGVILDWVPSHFVSDEHGLAYFDGTHLYDHMDPRKGFHPEWGSYIFNYGRNEVKEFLISNALFWLEAYHADGLRVDAVASMLYLDYSRRDGEWEPNRLGGRENLEAVTFLRELNETVYREHPDTQTIAEESTAWPQVSRPVSGGGLGFGMKWNMGWMHDILGYLGRDPAHRRYHHDQLLFSLWYAFNENFMLPLSHDEVVHGKGSLLRKMAGDDWQRFAGVRLLFSYMYAHPGKKLLFMGDDLAPWEEWDHQRSLPWHLLDNEPHRGVNRLVRDLNTLYRGQPALHRGDFVREGFSWIETGDRERSVIAFLRRDPGSGDELLAVCNFTPIPRNNYRVGVPRTGMWIEIFNSDAPLYGGTGQGNFGGSEATPVPAHGQEQSLSLTLPPLGAVYFRHGKNGTAS